MRALIAIVVGIALAGTASADGHARVRVSSGQTLWTLADRYRCSIDAIKRANRLRSNVIHPGQVLRIPTGVPRRSRTARSRRIERREPAAINRAAGQSVGKPWKGRLRRPSQLPDGRGYLLRRPHNTYGIATLVTTVQEAIAEVRRDHPELHTLAIGDLSSPRGGWLIEHNSHQSGRDIDVGFYYRDRPAQYPAEFAEANAENLDYAATWDLLVGFARTADTPGGVQAIFLDREVQGLLYDWAKERGIDDAYLDRLFQYPARSGDGLVRHAPKHADHMHIRFRCPPGDTACR